MRAHTTHIFLTGATGYIGGSVLTRLLSHKLSDTFGITVLVRDPAKAKEFRTLGVKATVGSNSDTKLLRQLAAEADIVFACADADDLEAANAILAGLKDRFEKTRTVPSLIHTSGTGVLVDDARGYVKTHIVLPGTIYGLSSGPLVDLGLQNPRSQQIPGLIDLGVRRGEVGYVGLGKNIWPHVHIKDVSDVFILIFDHILSPKEADPAHGRTGFYFAENGEYVLWDIAKAVASALHGARKIASDVPSSFSDEEIRRYFPKGTSYGTNSRCRADRARALGWRPRKGYQDLVASIKDEI
ncbi:hypothetical protein DXG03_000483 [Asterophora parasitica]|uniref:NAD(P)-binding domain-containing protein n=1 Tax=Asterophora parasitica TaxID=117018 RepID=A0A9P7GI25_9AGAR|nr:hypothetical protein DXG03_000483 [Asterophora parasitica]